MEKMTSVKAIKTYFEQADAISPEGGKPVKMDELKLLTSEEREELGKLCCEALGAEWTPPSK